MWPRVWATGVGWGGGSERGHLVDPACGVVRGPFADAGSAIEGAGARLEYLPAYSPDFNPIEPMWSKVKQGLKSREPRTARQLHQAARAAFAAVTATDCQGFFLHAGYAT